MNASNARKWVDSVHLPNHKQISKISASICFALWYLWWLLSLESLLDFKCTPSSTQKKSWNLAWLQPWKGASCFWGLTGLVELWLFWELMLPLLLVTCTHATFKQWCPSFNLWDRALHQLITCYVCGTSGTFKLQKPDYIILIHPASIYKNNHGLTETVEQSLCWCEMDPSTFNKLKVNSIDSVILSNPTLFEAKELIVGDAQLLQVLQLSELLRQLHYAIVIRINRLHRMQKV